MVVAHKVCETVVQLIHVGAAAEHRERWAATLQAHCTSQDAGCHIVVIGGIQAQAAQRSVTLRPAPESTPRASLRGIAFAASWHTEHAEVLQLPGCPQGLHAV